MIKRTLAGLLVVLLATPPAVFAQTTKAGVVTVVEGNVTKRRVALPDSPLKFKDDVFMQDTVTTGDQSLARLLLGGKAVVTVRERSVLTITEVPGRSTIDLQSGKFALAVAREKMGANEEIQIRTPNAVAGVRGTVVVTEVERQGAQVGTGVPAVVTNFFVLRGAITAQLLDANRNPFGAPFQVGTMQGFSAAGLATPRVQPVLAAQLGRITAGLQPTGAKRGGDAAKDQVKGQQVQTAVTLLEALSGKTSASALPPALLVRAEFLSTPGQGEHVATTTGDVITSLVANPDVFASVCPGLETSGSSSCTGGFLFNFAGFDGDFTSTSTDPLFAIVNRFLQTSSSFIRISQFGNGSLAGPLAHFTNSTILTGGSLLEIQGGKLKSTGTSALIGLDPTLIAAAQSLILMNGGSLTLAGPLLTDTNGTILTAGSFLDMKNGATLTDTSSTALVQLNGTVVGAVSALTMSNATMKLAGPLVTATNVTGPGAVLAAATLSLVGVDVASFVDGPFIAIENKSSLTSTGASPLIQLTSTKVDNDENIIRVATGSSINLAGSLLKATDTRLIAGNVNRSLISVTDGSSITTAGTTDPLLQFIGTASGLSLVTAARNFFALSFNTTTSSPAMTLSGPWLSAQLTDFHVGDPTSNTFTFLFIGDGTQVRSTSTSPFMSFSSSSVDTAGNLIDLRRSTASTPTRMTLAGPLLSATNSLFNHTTLGDLVGTTRVACCAAVFIGQGAQLSSTTTSPLIQLTGSTVIGNDSQSGGSFFVVADTFNGAAAAELVASSSVSLAGPLLSATNSTITSLFDLVNVRRSTLTSTTTSALISLSGGSATLGGTDVTTGLPANGVSLLDVVSGTSSGAAAPPASVSLAGPLLNMTGGASLNLTSALGIVSVFNGASVSSTTTSPFISISGSTVTQTNPSGFFNTLAAVGGLGGPSGTTPSTFTLAGPLLSVSNGTLNLQGGLVSVGNISGAFGTGTLIANDPIQPFVSLSGGTHSIANVSGGALFVLRGINTALSVDPVTAGLTLGTDQPLQRSGSGAFLQLSNGATLNTPRAVFLDTALLSASAPLLEITSGSSLTFSSEAITLNQRANLTSLVQPLLKVNGGTLTINGNAIRVAGGSALVTGDLFSVSGGGTLRIQNGGAALFVSGSSIVNIGGFLVNFTGVGNTVSISNGLCPCFTTSSGINVALQNGATSASVIGGFGTAVKNAAGNTFSVGAADAVIVINGGGSKVTVP